MATLNIFSSCLTQIDVSKPPKSKIACIKTHNQRFLVLNIGEAVPVFDLRVRFGFPKTEGGLLIITKMRGMKVAIAVDDVKEIVEADDGEVITAPNLVRTGDTEYVSKVTNVKGHMFISLDFDGMLSDDEVKAVVDMVKNQNE